MPICSEIISIIDQIQKNFESKHFDISSLSSEDDEFRKIVDKSTLNITSNLKQRIMEEFFASGPLTELLREVEITEIIINGYNSIFYEKNGKLINLEDQFSNEILFRNFTHRLCKDIGQYITLESPHATGYWRGFRVQIIGDPISKSTIISLRKHAEQPWTLKKLFEKQWCSKDQLTEIKKSLEEKENLFVIGPTSSGKTSVLSALLNETNENERSIILEDCPEIPLPNKASTNMLTRADSNRLLTEINLSDLLKLALRMRPDRLVVGEVRGVEAKDLLMALSTGHKGSIGTLHAHSAREALIRLEMLIQMGASQWSLQSIRKLIHLCLNKIIVLAKGKDGSRYLEGVYRISSLEEFGFLLEKVC